MIEDYRPKFIRHVLSQMGRPYIWGGKGDFQIEQPSGRIIPWPTETVFDCMGLVLWAVHRTGGRDRRKVMSTADLGAFPEPLMPRAGDLAWYKGHVEVVLNTIIEPGPGDAINITHMTVGCSGGTSATLTLQAARGHGACVSTKLTHLHRPDFIRFVELEALFNP